MTNTTDIKALRECLVELLDHVDSYGGKCWLFPEDVRSIIQSLGQLEAERQRADANEPVRCEGVPQHVHDMIDLQETIDELRAELAALKGDQVPMSIDADIIRDANRYRFLRDEDSWGEDSDSWDVETRTGLISSENLMELRLDHFDAAIDARMAASDIPFFNPVTAPQKPIVRFTPPINPAMFNADVMFGYNKARAEDKAAIEFSGIVVRDGE